MTKQKVAILVPAHNEAKVIDHTLKAIRQLSFAKHIYIVDDGSTDTTRKQALSYTKNVLTIKNRGKAEALNIAIEHFALTEKYNYILFMDADTLPQPDFLDYAMPIFAADKQCAVTCVVGRVEGYGLNWIEKYRQWEYQVSHFIYKEAQSFTKTVLVAPGCATVYRSSIFKELRIPKGTLTEDMDFTFILHRKGYFNMVFEEKCCVLTQDPRTIKDYVKQISRWYTGFWQNVAKHEIPWHGQKLDYEVTILALEGLYNGLLVMLLLVFFVPLALHKHLSILWYPFMFDLTVFFLPTLIWTAVKKKDISTFLFIPLFYVLRLLSSLIFLLSYFKANISKKENFNWSTNRYLLNRKE